MLKLLLRYKEIKEWYGRYERFLIPAALILGVIVDFVTFTSIDAATAFALLGFYLFIAGAVIVILNIRSGEERGKVFKYLRLLSPLALQFSFGALLSAAFIFYFFSGTVWVSWPFLGLIVFLMMSNELFRRYYLRPEAQIGVFYFIILTLATIIFPYFFRSIGAKIFLSSGGAAAALIAAYLLIFFRAVPSLRDRISRFAITILAITAFINALYFFNIIPPIPLAIRSAELAHEISRVNGNYELLAEDEPLFARLLPGKTFHKKEGERVYVFTSIFAPKGLETNIVHRWQHYDEAQKQWVTRDKLSFEISGGAKTGYRGYSFKSQVEAGRWRVSVETERGQALGRINFRILDSAVAAKLKTLIQ